MCVFFPLFINGIYINFMLYPMRFFLSTFRFVFFMVIFLLLPLSDMIRVLARALTRIAARSFNEDIMPMEFSPCACECKCVSFCVLSV